MTKVCIVCEEEKSLDRFDKKETSVDGHRNQCRNCLYEKRKERFEILTTEQKEEYKIIRNEKSKKYLEGRKKDPEYKLLLKKRRRERHIIRLNSDPLYKIKIAYSRRLNKYLRRGKCDKSTNAPYFLDKLGCSFEEFKIYLESKFEDWMSWENYGKYNGELNYGWDIDHINPLSNAKTEEEIYNLSNYTNLQPLCSKTNRDIKKNKVKDPQ